MPAVWADLNKAGMVSGAAYAKGLRTVKTCVGKEWCRFGTQDSTGLGVEHGEIPVGLLDAGQGQDGASRAARAIARKRPARTSASSASTAATTSCSPARRGSIFSGTTALGHADGEDEAIEMIAALVQLYREQGRYLERIYKWAKRVGVDTIRAQVVADPARRRALFDRFVVSQRSAQRDPWAERVAGKDAHEFAPLAELEAAR